MTSFPDTIDAPGCFGSALTFTETASECRSCMFAEQCRPISAQALVALRAKLGIVNRAVRTKTRVQPVAADGGSLISTLPVKVAALIKTIEGMGVRVAECMARRENPFATRPAFMRVTCHLVMNMPQGISKAQLKHALAKKLNWSEGTAAAHTIQAFQCLVAIGAAEEHDGRLCLRK